MQPALLCWWSHAVNSKVMGSSSYGSGGLCPLCLIMPPQSSLLHEARGKVTSDMKKRGIVFVTTPKNTVRISDHRYIGENMSKRRLTKTNKQTSKKKKPKGLFQRIIPSTRETYTPFFTSGGPYFRIPTVNISSTKMRKRSMLNNQVSKFKNIPLVFRDTVLCYGYVTLLKKNICATSADMFKFRKLSIFLISNEEISFLQPSYHFKKRYFF